MVSNRSGQRTWCLVSFQGRMCKWLTYNLPHSSVLASSVFCPFPKRKQQDWGNDSVGEAFVTEYARTWIWVPSTHKRPEVAAQDSVEQGKMEDWPRESQKLENPRVIVSSAGWRLTFTAVLWPPQRHKDLKRWKKRMAKPQRLFLWHVPSTKGYFYATVVWHEELCLLWTNLAPWRRGVIWGWLPLSWDCQFPPLWVCLGPTNSRALKSWRVPLCVRNLGSEKDPAGVQTVVQGPSVWVSLSSRTAEIRRFSDSYITVV